jgi:predicted DNA-binding transcriptional regulator AlpA
MDHATKDRLLPRHAVQDMTGLVCSSLYELMRHPDPHVRFPRPIRIGESRVRWSEQAIQEWIERQKAMGAVTAA